MNDITNTIKSAIDEIDDGSNEIGPKTNSCNYSTERQSELFKSELFEKSIKSDITRIERIIEMQSTRHAVARNTDKNLFGTMP